MQCELSQQLFLDAVETLFDLREFSEKRACATCGKEFSPSQKPQRFCCSKCKRVFFQRKEAARIKARFEFIQNNQVPLPENLSDMDKKTFIALIHGLIDSTKACDAPNLVRCEIRRTLYESHARFRQNLTGKRLAAYDAAWDNLKNTTADEVSGTCGVFEKNSEDLKKVQQLLISRFEALRKIIQET
jgi:endogenous inhibitor of DNA gyrase (YacG/DUF329 family)